MLVLPVPPALIKLVSLLLNKILLAAFNPKSLFNVNLPVIVSPALLTYNLERSERCFPSTVSASKP